MTNGLSLDSLRHIGMKLVCALIAALAAITIAGALLMSASGKWPAAVLAVMLSVYPCMLVMQRRIDAPARMTMSISVVAMPALLLFVSEGQSWQTDLHMLFFALLAAASILCDWKALLAATVVVAVHHVGVDLLSPAWLFTGTSSFARVVLHAVILLVEAGTLMWVAQRIVALIDANDVQSRQREAASAALTEERADQAAVVDTVTAALGNALTALAGGDMTSPITADFPSSHAGLKQDYNATLNGLEAMISTVAVSSETIRLGTDEIAQASDDLARRTESNAASLEQTSAALVQIDDRLKAATLSSADTVKRADQAISTVRSGRSTADEAVQAMGRVSGSAKGIDSVIEGLDKIAFQTRVLAMNAAVEAGRAGDAGRGFAVVADLVSALAMRAEEEAKRARDQLTVTQTEIVTAVSAVERVDGALAAIATDVDEVHKLLGTIASDNHAQSLAITEITAAVGSMDRATQQNAAMVEETSAGARMLATEVASLAAHAAQFRIGNAVTMPSKPKTTAAPAPAIIRATPPARAKSPARPKGRSTPIGDRTVAATTEWADF